MSCHTHPDWAKQKEGIGQLVHDPIPSSCNSCHASARPSLPHPSGGDCVSCHTHPDWAKQKEGIGQLVHDPMPSSCNSCHASARPSLPHPSGGDCVSCHTLTLIGPSREKASLL